MGESRLGEVGVDGDHVVVLPSQLDQGLAKRLRTAGASVTLEMYERASHTTLIGAMAWPLRWIAPVHADVLAFIEAAPPLP